MKLYGYTNGMERTCHPNRDALVFLSSWYVSRRMEIFQKFDRVKERSYGGWEHSRNLNPRYITYYGDILNPDAVSFMEYDI